MIHLAWLVPVFPLLGFLIIALAKKGISKSFAGILGSATVACSFIISAGIFLQQSPEATTLNLFSWIHSGNLDISFSFLIDPASEIMLLIITGVGLLIHIYSIGYMHDDENVDRFFAYMNLFVFFMLLLVMGSNYLVMFAGWEGVGLCSYLLIGFWFKNTEYNHAANKAFIMNRIGDLGFLLGMILMYVHFGSLSFDHVFASAKLMPDNQPVMIAITLLLFVGACGKSAQIPLYTWLPDAMAGPTPVSALIHAATMVTAGVYMIVRSNILYSIAPFTLSIIAMVGTATAIFAATIALVQTDIKKILAYSTVSQLGYMFAALGAGAYSSALFHVTTHAFFKALLFLAAGSIIHALGGEQDLRKMGGLRKKLPITFVVFVIGTLAISGVPPLSGFFSKDEILSSMWMYNRPLFTLLSITSVLTAVYMFRMLFLVFYGSFRGKDSVESHAHESPAVMTGPLIILAVLSAIGGFLGIPEIFGSKHLFAGFLEPILSRPSGLPAEGPSHFFEWSLLLVSVIVLALLIPVTYRRFVSANKIPPANENDLQPVGKLLYRKYYVDEIYDAIIVRPLMAIGNWFYSFLDLKIINGLVGSVNKSLVRASGMLRLVQTGNIGLYIFAMVFGIIAMLAYTLWLK